MKSILVASKDPAVFKIITDSMGSKYRVEVADDRDDYFRQLKKKRYDFLFADVTFILDADLQEDYKSYLQRIWHYHPTLAIIVMTPPALIREAVMIVKAGANNYLTYPLDPQEIKLVTDTTHESIMVKSERDYLRDQFWLTDISKLVRTESPLMKDVYAKVNSVALTKSTILLYGETGTGKGVIASIIHLLSNRKANQFISVHCGAIPETLLESELFGHEKGSFTGAIRRKLGKFEIAKGGTIFLDEVGTITPAAQIKLLQVLQDGIFQRVGGEETIEADVRVIAATNADLKRLSDDGLFRKDLYYRLNVFPIDIPPLRDRIEDIPYLVETFLNKMNKFNLKNITNVHPRVVEGFRQYPWPGNIRELENLIERAYILEGSQTLCPENFPAELFESDDLLPVPPADDSVTLDEFRRAAINNIEITYLRRVLAKNKGKIKESAQVAGMSTRQLHKLMKKYNLRKEEYK